MGKNRFFSKEALLFLVLTVAQVWFLLTFVDLKPHVGYDVFFSGDDPGYQDDIHISRLFPRNDSQVLVNFSGDIFNPRYQTRVREFGDLLLSFEEVQDVKSIMRGPRSVTDAAGSPLWRRLLIPGQGASSNMFVVLKPSVPAENLSTLIPRIENLKAVFESRDFTIKISGFPYITELIRRHLNEDLRTFTMLAFLIFGLVVIFVFHSWQIFLGMVVTCFNAAALTLIGMNLLHIRIGILTANLTTIIFVMTLSHMVFLTFNWKHLPDIEDNRAAAREAMRITFPASFWSMATTLLGFLSLLYVQAKPIREFGAAGAVGTLIAFAVAYSVYPAFLSLKRPSHEKTDLFVRNFYKRLFSFFEPCRWIIFGAIIGLAVVTLPYLKTLNLDPSLISFFSPKSEITAGLKHIDARGGGNPLVIVIKSGTGEPLSSGANFKKMRELQDQLETHPDVGTLLSMPLLVEEARRGSSWSFLFSNQTLLKWLASAKYDSIARGFITDDQKSALLFFRMNEEGRKKHRLEVVAQIKSLIEKKGFDPYLTGGIYALQGNLSRHVAVSLVYGLRQLLFVFLIIAFIASLKVRTALAMSFSLGVIPLCVLGVVGVLGLPLDMIAAPAANIAISMGIDAMLHMVNASRHFFKHETNASVLWHKVRERMWEPVLTSMFIVASGFAIFFFSSFPPTQRFGGQIVLGTVISAFSAIFIFSLLAQPRGKPHKAHPRAAPPAPFSRLAKFRDS